MATLTKAQLITEIEVLRARLAQAERERDEARAITAAPKFVGDVISDALGAPRVVPNLLRKQANVFQRSPEFAAAREEAMRTGRSVKVVRR
jgi:hypothetical protein